MTTTFRPERILYGADYNPEQWPREVWNEDLRLMQAAACNVMSIGIFSWVHLEPEEGHYQFDWLDEVVAKLTAAQVGIILATPSAAPPQWLAQRYPQTLRQGPDNETGRAGYRVNFCPTSPVYRDKSAAMATALARRYGAHPNLLLWHISNEYYKECHCELCQAAFRLWLQKKYGSLAALNDAWWTSHWGHCYTDWEQIQSAYIWPRIEWTIFGQRLDWLRFQADQHLNCYLGEKRAIEAVCPGKAVTTNAHMTLVGETDWHRFAPHMDVMSWDAYPRYSGVAKTDLPIALETAFTHDFFRGARDGQPFLRMEGEPCGRIGGRQMRPGVLRLTALQALAHGSDSVQFFQWRDGRGGTEKFHGAMVPHAGHEDTRTFREHQELGRTLSALGALAGTTTPAEVAFLFDKENLWALELATNARGPERGYVPVCLSHYREFWERGIPVEVISPLQSFRRFQLVVAPLLYLLRPGVAESLTQFVENGGTLVTTYWSAFVDEHDRVFEGGAPGPLRKLLGLWVDQLDQLNEGETLNCTPAQPAGLPGAGMMPNDFRLRSFSALTRVETALPLAIQAEGLYQGFPALTVNHVGAGRAYFWAGEFCEKGRQAFYERLSSDLRLRRLLVSSPRPGVTVQLRTDGSAEYLFAMNFNDMPVPLMLEEGRYRIAGADGCAFSPEAPVVEDGRLTLPPYSCQILCKHSAG